MELREAVNVPDALQRDALVRRVRAIRERAVLDRDAIAHWNATHPGEPPLSAAFEDAMIAWCDGEGPLPGRAA